MAEQFFRRDFSAGSTGTGTGAAGAGGSRVRDGGEEPTGRTAGDAGPSVVVEAAAEEEEEEDDDDAAGEGNVRIVRPLSSKASRRPGVSYKFQKMKIISKKAQQSAIKERDLFVCFFFFFFFSYLPIPVEPKQLDLVPTAPAMDPLPHELVRAQLQELPLEADRVPEDPARAGLQLDEADRKPLGRAMAGGGGGGDGGGRGRDAEDPGLGGFEEPVLLSSCGGGGGGGHTAVRRGCWWWWCCCWGDWDYC